MADKSAIEWCDATWTPLRARNRETGRVGTICVHKSAGCANCWAETWGKFRGTGAPFTPSGLKQVETFLDEKMLTWPLRWRDARKVFVCSQTDLFGEWWPDEWIDRVFAVMALCPQHVFQITTKRPERMRAYSAEILSLTGRERSLRIATSMYRDHPAERVVMSGLRRPDAHVGDFPWPLPNAWLGVSVEDQATANERIPLLLETPAAVRWVSYEPALGPVSFAKWLPIRWDAGRQVWQREREIPWVAGRDGLSWIVVGGESGPVARPFDLAWARSTIAQCRAAGVAPYVKQLGSVPMIREDEWRAASSARLLAARNRDRVPVGYVPLALTDRKGGDMAEWPDDLRVREFPKR